MQFEILCSNTPRKFLLPKSETKHDTVKRFYVEKIAVHPTTPPVCCCICQCTGRQHRYIEWDRVTSFITMFIIFIAMCASWDMARCAQWQSSVSQASLFWASFRHYWHGLMQAFVVQLYLQDKHAQCICYFTRPGALRPHAYLCCAVTLARQTCTLYMLLHKTWSPQTSCIPFSCSYTCKTDMHNAYAISQDLEPSDLDPKQEPSAIINADAHDVLAGL